MPRPTMSPAAIPVWLSAPRIEATRLLTVVVATEPTALLTPVLVVEMLKSGVSSLTNWLTIWLTSACCNVTAAPLTVTVDP
jgi:integral membrane sensor domain MASE1